MNRILFNILMTRLWGWREEKKCCAQTTLFIEIIRLKYISLSEDQGTNEITNNI